MDVQKIYDFLALFAEGYNRGMAEAMRRRQEAGDEGHAAQAYAAIESAVTARAAWLEYAHSLPKEERPGVVRHYFRWRRWAAQKVADELGLYESEAYDVVDDPGSEFHALFFHWKETAGEQQGRDALTELVIYLGLGEA